MGHLSGEGGITVPTATLVSVVDDGAVLPPDYVKMDIEGAELLALRGASRTFLRFRPVLFLATHGREVATECRRLLELWGYDCRNMGSKSNSDWGEIIAKFAALRESKKPGSSTGQESVSRAGSRNAQDPKVNRGGDACSKRW
jgi:hypothetical protein